MVQDKEPRWVQDYVSKSEGWITDRLTQLKATASLLQEILQDEKRCQQVRCRRVYWETTNEMKFLQHGAMNEIVQAWATKLVELKKKGLRMELILIWAGNQETTTEEESCSTDEEDLKQ
jgi:hypothetical protein